jgi:hypothetical protein
VHARIGEVRFRRGVGRRCRRKRAMVAASILVSRYPALVEALTVLTRRAKSTTPWTCNEPARWSPKTSLLGWPQQNHVLPCQGRWNGQNSGSAAAITRAGVVTFTDERSHGSPMKGRWSAGDTVILTGWERNGLEMPWVSPSTAHSSPEVLVHGTMPLRGRSRWKGEPIGGTILSREPGRSSEPP